YSTEMSELGFEEYVISINDEGSARDHRISINDEGSARDHRISINSEGSEGSAQDRILKDYVHSKKIITSLVYSPNMRYIATSSNKYDNMENSSEEYDQSVCVWDFVERERGANSFNLNRLTSRWKLKRVSDCKHILLSIDRNIPYDLEIIDITTGSKKTLNTQGLKGRTCEATFLKDGKLVVVKGDPAYRESLLVLLDKPLPPSIRDFDVNNYDMRICILLNGKKSLLAISGKVLKEILETIENTLERYGSSEFIAQDFAENTDQLYFAENTDKISIAENTDKLSIAENTDQLYPWSVESSERNFLLSVIHNKKTGTEIKTETIISVDELTKYVRKVRNETYDEEEEDSSMPYLSNAIIKLTRCEKNVDKKINELDKNIKKLDKKFDEIIEFIKSGGK
ncbi:18431_t:CDS:2, partial [Acaulospora morrowiae]